LSAKQANYVLQGELEHWHPKARYKRTSKKGFKQQLAQIEQRQARIRRIKQRSTSGNNASGKSPELRQPQDADPAIHHHIGASESDHFHIGRFCQEHANDPAVMVRSFGSQLMQI
jgi:hypothetical protein